MLWSYELLQSQADSSADAKSKVGLFVTIITKSSILDLDQSKIHFWQFVTLLQALFVML